MSNFTLKIPRRGWKYATDKEMAGPAATWLGLSYCILPEAILAWAKKHKVNLYRLYRDGRGLKQASPQGLCFEKAFWADAPYHGIEKLDDIPCASWV